MKIIVPTYEIIQQNYNNLLTDMLKHIELCGRTCYKSEDRITDISYEKFTQLLEEAEHGAMLEHGTVYLTIPIGTPVTDGEYMLKTDIVHFFKKNAYSKVIREEVSEKNVVNIKGQEMTINAWATVYYITTNWRVISENKDCKIAKFFELSSENEDFKKIIAPWMTPPTDKHEKRYTVRFTCDIGVSREYNRHRKDSIGEESTRYCNYTKGKFGGELTIVKPIWLTKKNIKYIEDIKWTIQELSQYVAKGDDCLWNDIDYWVFANLAAEYAYMNLIRLGWKAQQARDVLLLSTKTELVHTSFASDWGHFFNLRAIGTTGAPHMSAKELAWPLMEDFLNRKWISLDMIDSQKYYEIKQKYPNIIDYILK